MKRFELLILSFFLCANLCKSRFLHEISLVTGFTLKYRSAMTWNNSVLSKCVYVFSSPLIPINFVSYFVIELFIKLRLVIFIIFCFFFFFKNKNSKQMFIRFRSLEIHWKFIEIRKQSCTNHIALIWMYTYMRRELMKKTVWVSVCSADDWFHVLL